MNRIRSFAKRALKRAAVSALFLTLGPGRATFANELGWGWADPAVPYSPPIPEWGFIQEDTLAGISVFVQQNPTANDVCSIEGPFLELDQTTFWPIPTVFSTFTAATLNFGTGPVTFAGGGNIIGDINVLASGVSQSQGSLSSANFYVGGTANGQTTNFGSDYTIYGGVTAISGTLRIYDLVNGAGNPLNAVNLAGGTLSVGALDLTTNPISVFNWTGGTFAVTGADGLTIGSLGPIGSNLTLNSNRALNVSQTLYVASDGSLAVPGGLVSAGVLVIDGAASMSAGSLTESLGEEIGAAGNGVFTQTGGTHTTGSLDLGFSANGTYNLGGSGSLFVTGFEYVGVNASGTFSQGGGTHTVGSVGLNNQGDSFQLGSSPGSAGYYTLTGGIFTVTNSESETVGNGGSGSFIQTGGTNTITSGGLQIGGLGTGSGVYNLSGTGALTVGGTEYIGLSGSGTFIQTGGTHTATYIQLGSNAGGAGYYNMSGGSLTASGWLQAGYNGIGSFVQTGGAVTVGGIGIFLGSNSGGTGSGTYSLSDPGSVTTSYIYVCSGMFSQLSGTVSVTNTLYVGVHSGLSGSFQLSSGSLTANSSTQPNPPGEVIGVNGTGTFVQTGGVNVTNRVRIASAAGSTGIYDLSGGSLAATNTSTLLSEFVGDSGTGTFAQTGGSNSSASLGVGVFAGANGTYSLSGTGVLSITGSELLGDSGSGVFYQSAGANTAGYLFVGANAGATGRYNLSGGSLNVGANEYVGYSGAGTFVQTGGTHVIAGTLTVATNAGSTGMYNLQGGSLNAAAINVNPGGTFNLQGPAPVLSAQSITDSGIMLVTGGGFYVDAQSGSTGAYALNGNGLLTVTGNEYIGYGSSGFFTQTGGAHGTGGSLYLGYSAGSTGSYSISGGLLSVSGNLFVGPGGTGTFAQSGGISAVAGTVNIGALGNVQLSGGKLTATSTVNNGVIAQTGGSAALGTLSGSGTLTVGASAGNAAAMMTVSSFNQSAVTINAGGTLAVPPQPVAAVDNVNSLTIAPGGQLDLGNGTLFIHYPAGADPIVTILGDLARGYDNGKWDGSGIISTTAAANTYFRNTGIGIADSADNAVNGLPPDTIELKYTLAGDVNLDTLVNSADLQTLLFGLNRPGAWDQGDFNYDGQVNSADLQALLFNLNTPLIPGMVAVPDPTGAAALAIIGGLSLCKRRRRRTGVDARS
jgi:fibronectin-binding autotransporter adhesin